NMGALGESRFGAGRGVSNMAYVKVATGTGCGLVVNGSIYRGSFGSAGELGHVTIDEEGPLCDCGNRGCLETFASAHAIVHDAVHGISLAREGSTARPTPRDEASTDIADVVTAALAGDPAAIAAIRRAGEHVGVAVAGLVNLMNPSLILIDGGVARAGDILLEPIRNAIATRSLKAASTNACVELAALGEDAIALGAVAAVIDAAFSLPQTPAMQPHHIHSSYRSTPAGS
ncbi:MAG TPA: ROK family protein, partial [Ktedonobacterales bacterium]